MDTMDRSSNALTPWSPSPLASRGTVWSEPTSEPAAGSKPLNIGVILRALRRHWWQILAIWLIGSAGLGFLAYKLIKPVYDVFSLIEVTPPETIIVSNGSNGTQSFRAFLDTQILLVTTPDVIQQAIIKPEIVNLPKIREMLDPETELRDAISVSIPRQGTNLIMVRMSDKNPSQAAALVNAVVDSYIKSAGFYAKQAITSQVTSLTDRAKEIEKKVDDQKQKLRDMYKQAGENPSLAAKDAKAEPEQGATATPSVIGRSQMTLDEYRSLKSQLADVTIQRYQAEADVNFHQQELRNRPSPAAAGSPEELEAKITAEFQSLPEVLQIRDQIAALEGKLDLAAKSVRRRATDPATKYLRDQIADLKLQYKDLWERAYPTLKARLQNGGPVGDDPLTIARTNEYREARKNLTNLQIKEKLLQDQLRAAEIEAKTANNETVDVQFAQAELDYNQGILTTIRRRLEQLNLDAQKGTQISLRQSAEVPKVPSSDNRIKALLVAPVAMLFLTCALFILIEFRGARVADPDEFSQRLRLGVIGVVPPLPSLGSSRRALSVRGQRDEKRRIEEFVQSLDHLRVTLCAPRPGVSHRRCVLITSATGGEGKTTLAAQLAGRCANAGLMTLLIDADLRRPSLGDLLEVPEGPGLVDVLTGEASPESAMVVIGNAGGFHLLPAGTIGQDPSRLLQGDRLGQIIGQFRETFDIVIIDAPPVLAVPDALLLGRWTDGAVLAVRHDTSRFPLVERANKRLASIGVPVLGAVVNGCRPMESAYGSYRYTPYAVADAPADGGANLAQDD